MTLNCLDWKISNNFSYDPLLGILEDLTRLKSEEIIFKLKLNDSKPLKIVDFNENVVLYYEEASFKKTFLQIGYPFSVFEKEIAPMAGGLLRICLKGPLVRDFQKKQIKNLKACEVIGRENFLELTRNLLSKFSSFNYICPYSFRGDVYISEFFMENFRDSFNLNVKNKFSLLFKDIGNGYLSYDLDNLKKHIKLGVPIVLPDLIDSHFDNSFKVIQHFHKTNPIFLVGRNIIIYDKVYYLDESDFLLNDRNIDLYMIKLLNPFLGDIKLKTPCFKKMSLKKVLLNFLSSQSVRDINLDLAYDLINILLKENSEIFLTNGNPLSKKDEEWISSFFTKFPYLKNKVKVLSSNSMYELQQKVEENKISLCFSCDTSIPHMMSYVGITSIVMIKPEQFDKNSLLSVVTNSSIGFCRLTQPQIPVFLSKRNESQIFKQIISLIKSYNSKNFLGENSVNFFETLYPFDEFFNFPIKAPTLMSWELNSPLNKIKNMKNG